MCTVSVCLRQWRAERDALRRTDVCFLKLTSQVVLWDEDETDGQKFDSP